MNALALRAHAGGLGFVSDGRLATGSWEGIDERGAGGGGDNGDVPWYIGAAPVIGIIGKTVSSIFAPYQASVAQAGGYSANQYQPPGNDYDYHGYPPRPTGSAGVDSEGLMLFGSRIGWLPIVIGVGALFLLQSKGFSRR